MAIRLEDEYTNATAADADYPEGSFKNETTPGALDGTPFEKKWANDIIGFLQKLLDAASITPSGSPDTVQASQYYTALTTLFQAVATGQLLGDGTDGRKVRRSRVWIRDGSAASTIAVRMLNDWNGDSFSEVDDISCGGTVSNVSLNCSSSVTPYIDIGSGALTGNCVAILAANIYSNLCGTQLAVYGSAASNGIRLWLTQSPDGSNINLPTLVDTGDILIDVTYITDA